MKTRIAAIGLALLVAVIGAIAVISYAHKADDRAVAGQKVQEVYIATKVVPQGTSEKSAIDQGLITRQKVVAKGVPTGAMTSVASNASDVVALTAISAGEIVLTERFGAPSQVQTTSGVPAGKVAISVGLSDPAGIKAYLKAGSHIAIYDTFNVGRITGKLTPAGGIEASVSATKLRATAVVLPDVQVLNVQTPKNSGSSQNSSSPTGGALLVTVAVAPGDASRLVHAIQTGDLFGVLLGSGAKISPRATASDANVVGP